MVIGAWRDSDSSISHTLTSGPSGAAITTCEDAGNCTTAAGRTDVLALVSVTGAPSVGVAPGLPAETIAAASGLASAAAQLCRLSARVSSGVSYQVTSAAALSPRGEMEGSATPEPHAPCVVPATSPRVSCTQSCPCVHDVVATTAAA
jgi:hypothetical protein